MAKLKRRIHTIPPINGQTQTHHLNTAIIFRNSRRITLKKAVIRHVPTLIHGLGLIPPRGDEASAYTLAVRVVAMAIVHGTGFDAVRGRGRGHGEELVAIPAGVADYAVRPGEVGGCVG